MDSESWLWIFAVLHKLEDELLVDIFFCSSDNILFQYALHSYKNPDRLKAVIKY